MKFCIDDANVEKIRRIYEYYPIDGVSTNPSILAGRADSSLSFIVMKPAFRRQGNYLPLRCLRQLPLMCFPSGILKDCFR